MTKMQKVMSLTVLAAALAACGQQNGTAQMQAGASAAAAAMASDAANAGSVTVQTARGEVSVPKNPERIAVFDFGMIDTLDALGVPVGAAVDSSNLPYIQAVLDKAKPVGTLFEPNYEALHAYQPQLIIAGSRTNRNQVFEELAKVAPAVEMTADTANMLESAKARIDAFALIFDKQEQAEKLKAELDQAFAQAREAAKGKGKGMVLLVNGGKMSTFGPESRLSGWLYKDIGIEPADSGVKEGSHGQPVSFEYIKEKNPDWLFVLDRAAAIGEEGAAAKDVLDNPLVAQTEAWKKGQVVYLDAGTYLAAGGVRQLQTAVKQVSDAFNAAQ